MQQLNIDDAFMAGLNILFPMRQQLDTATHSGGELRPPTLYDWERAELTYHGAAMTAPYNSDAHMFACYLRDTAQDMQDYLRG